MSDYPVVYGHCDAGCKRRVVPYEEMADMGALKPVELGKGNTTIDPFQFDCFVVINEAETYQQIYTLDNVDKTTQINELYAETYLVKKSSNMSYCISLYIKKEPTVDVFKMAVKYKVNDGEWSDMNHSKIFGLKRLPL